VESPEVNYVSLAVLIDDDFLMSSQERRSEKFASR
jgi:hypothetical protein